MHTTNDEDRGLYRKYSVIRLNDAENKHKDCKYFVLDLTHDPYAMTTLRRYASACLPKFPKLYFDLSDLIQRAVQEKWPSYEKQIDYMLERYHLSTRSELTNAVRVLEAFAESRHVTMEDLVNSVLKGDFAQYGV